MHVSALLCDTSQMYVSHPSSCFFDSSGGCSVFSSRSCNSTTDGLCPSIQGMHACTLLLWLQLSGQHSSINTHVSQRERTALVRRKSSRHACKVSAGVCSGIAPLHSSMTACPCTSALWPAKADPLGIWFVTGDRHANRRLRSKKSRLLKDVRSEAVRIPPGSGPRWHHAYPLMCKVRQDVTGLPAQSIIAG